MLLKLTTGYWKDPGFIIIDEVEEFSLSPTVHTKPHSIKLHADYCMEFSDTDLYAPSEGDDEHPEYGIKKLHFATFKQNGVERQIYFESGFLMNNDGKTIESYR